jgi:hypothetical protein
MQLRRTTKACTRPPRATRYEKRRAEKEYDRSCVRERHKYVPRINIRGKLWTKSREDSLYSDEVDYGVDARKGKSWAIFPDQRYRWGSFDELMSNMEDVRAAYTTGTRLAAKNSSGRTGACSIVTAVST